MRRALLLLPLLVGCAAAPMAGSGGYLGMAQLHPELFQGQAEAPGATAASIGAVTLTGTQTVTGAKTFNNSANVFVANGYGINGQTSASQGLSASGASTVVKSGNTSGLIYLSNNSYFYAVFSAAGMQVPAVTLATCNAAAEWTIAADALSGVSTGKRSKLCLCTSDGAAGYKWQNIATATLGTTTTCGTE